MIEKTLASSARTNYKLFSIKWETSVGRTKPFRVLFLQRFDYCLFCTNAEVRYLFTVSTHFLYICPEDIMSYCRTIIHTLENSYPLHVSAEQANELHISFCAPCHSRGSCIKLKRWTSGTLCGCVQNKVPPLLLFGMEGLWKEDPSAIFVSCTDVNRIIDYVAGSSHEDLNS